jgi:hypothetical protein
MPSMRMALADHNFAPFSYGGPPGAVPVPEKLAAPNYVRFDEGRSFRALQSLVRIGVQPFALIPLWGAYA